MVFVAAGAKETAKTWDELVYMQDMNPSACASQTTPAAGVTSVPTKTLTDIRDGNTYTVRKLKDGKCWMTQNLRLIKSMTLTSDDSDIIENYYLPPTAVLDKTNDNNKQFSASDESQSKIYSGNTGNGAYYNWYAATAGTGNVNITTSGQNAPFSICPKGWKLPTGGSNSDFYQLLSGVQTAEFTSEPYYFAYSGYILNSVTNTTVGNGYYWSSTVGTDARPIILYINKDSFNATYLENRYNGISVRCVAR